MVCKLYYVKQFLITSSTKSYYIKSKRIIQINQLITCQLSKVSSFWNLALDYCRNGSRTIYILIVHLYDAPHFYNGKMNIFRISTQLFISNKNPRSEPALECRWNVPVPTVPTQEQRKADYNFKKKFFLEENYSRV